MSTQATAGRHTAARTGLAMFAGIMMVVAGLFQALIGLAGVFRDQIYVTTHAYIFQFDLTAWGWTHLLLGALVIAAGVAVVEGATWGRVVGLVLAILSMLANFAFIPYYPVWSIIVIALDAGIVFALATIQSDA